MNDEAISPRPLAAAARTASRTLRRWRYRYARWLAAALAGLAAMLGVGAVLPTAPETRAVMLAAKDIPTGAEIGAGDVTAAKLPADAVTYSVPDRVVGRRAAAGIGAGEPITEHRLALSRQLPPGHVVLAIPTPAHATTHWLNPGDRALAMVPGPDVAAAVSATAPEDYPAFHPGSPSRAIDVVVVSTSASAPEPTPQWTDGPAGGSAVLLSVAEEDAMTVASAAREDSLYLALTP